MYCYSFKNNMAKIKPFKAIRPTRDKVSLVASRSYLSYDKETLIEKLENNPSLLYIIDKKVNENQCNHSLQKNFLLIKTNTT